MKIALGLFMSIAILFCSYVLYTNALNQATYLGLPTVACIDYTKPIVQNYSFFLSLKISEKQFPLSPTIGHDFGKCLHTIFVSDTSGKVFVRANDAKTYTLGQFFDVWKKTFSVAQIGNSKGQVRVWVNGKSIKTVRDTPLLPGNTITVILK